MEVFRFFTFLLNIAGLQLYSVKSEAVTATCKFWSQVGLQTKKIDCGIGDLTKIHEEYKVIVGNVISSPVFLILVLPTKGMSRTKVLLKVLEEKHDKATFVVRVSTR